MTAKNKSIATSMIVGIVTGLASLIIWNMFLEDMFIKESFDNTMYEDED